MPRVTFPNKTVILNEETKLIFAFFDKAIQKYKKEEGSLAPLAHAAASPVDSTFVTTLLAKLEVFSGKALGAGKINLSAVEHHLSADAYLLFNQYRGFLIRILMQHKKHEAYSLLGATTEVSNRSVLVIELLLRLAAEAIDENQQSKSHAIVLKIINYFYEQLIESDVFINKGWKKKGTYFSGFADALYRTYNQWQLVFKGMVDVTQQLNSNKDKINQALDELIKLRRAILVTIIAECMQVAEVDLASKHSLTEDFLEVSLASAMKKLAKKVAVNTVSLSTLESLFETTILPDECQQLLLKANNKKLQELFMLLMKTNNLAKITEKLSNIVVGAGWFPFMAGIINTADFNRKFGDHHQRCITMINDYLGGYVRDKYKNLDVALLRNKDLRTFTILLNQIDTIQGLADLNNPQLLKQLSARFKNEINELLVLQHSMGCSIVDKSKLQQLVGAVSVSDVKDTEVATLSSVRALFSTAVETFQTNPLAAETAFTNIIQTTDQMVAILELSLFHKGTLLLQNNQFQAALDCFNGIKWLDDDKIHFNKALCHLGLGNRSDAVLAFKQIKNRTSETDKLWQMIGSLTSGSVPPSPSVSADLASVSRGRGQTVTRSRSHSMGMSGVSASAQFTYTDSQGRQSPQLFSEPEDPILFKFRNFNYRAKLNDRVDKRELKIISEPVNIDEIKTILKQDVKEGSKTLYLYAVKKNEVLTWFYFTSKNDGKNTVHASIPYRLVPPILNDYYTKAPSSVKNELLGRYLRLLLLDDGFFKAFSMEMELEQISRREEEISQSEMSSGNR